MRISVCFFEKVDINQDFSDVNMSSQDFLNCVFRSDYRLKRKRVFQNAIKYLFTQTDTFYSYLMTNQQSLAFKSQLKEHCRLQIQDRMDALKNAMNKSQESANEETKSSAGDKYETSRAMGHLEKDMYARQLAETGKEMASMMNVDCSLLYSSVSPGSVVSCEQISYFILAGIGKMEFNGKFIYVISPNAPLAKSLLGKRKDDSVTINNGIQQIKEIF